MKDIRSKVPFAPTFPSIRVLAHKMHAMKEESPVTDARTANRHPCKSSVKEKTHVARRARESAHFSVKIFSSHWRLSAVVPAFAEPDIHLLPRATQGPRRRLSWCSLPVPKQSVKSLKRVLISIAHSA